MDKQTERLMQQEAKFFGVNPGFKLMTSGAFSGINQSSSRMMMKDEEFFWLENFIKTGDGALRTLWDKGSAIYTAPSGKIIIYFYFFNIATNNYVAIFLSDGTAVQVNTTTLVNTIISSATNTFYNAAVSTQLPVCGQWGTQYLLIANNITANSYWVWDSKVLYTAGNLAPSVLITDGGSGYTSAPSVAAYGGSGTGATFTATVNEGSVVSVLITNPGTGYEPGDVPQLIFTGGGSDNGAQLTAVLVAGTVQSVLVTNPGSGYTAGTYALGFSGGAGTGAAGTYTVDATLTVISTEITNNGSGYTGSPTVSFPSGGGTGAAGVAILSAGKVASVTVVHGGTGFTTTPTLEFVGGGGTGATAAAVLTAGVITSVTVTLGGSGYTSAPAIVVQGGSNRAAAAEITLMPFGVSGTSIETFQQRVWLPYPNQQANQVNGGTFYVSSPGSFSDFSTADGGLIFTNTDSFLRSQYTNIKQSNGYLYPFGDSSVSVISNVQTSGSPSTTTFNYQNTDPQIGTSWRDSCQAFSRTIVFANQFGIFGLYGGSVTKVSTKIDNLFTSATSNGVYIGSFNPSSAVANIYSKKVFLLLFTTIDPTMQAQRTVLLSWDEKDWNIASQTVNLTFIGTQEVNSNIRAYGTDGNSLYPLFNTPSTVLTKKISTKLYGANNPLVQKESMGVYFQAQDKSGSEITMTSISIDSEHGSYGIPKIAPFPSTSIAPYNPIVAMGSGDVFGVNLGLTLTTNSPDFVLEMIGIGAVETGSIAMSSTLIDGTIETL